MRRLLLMLLLMGAVHAKEPVTVPGLPAYGPDKPLVLPKVRQTTLANGLTLWLIERHDLPLVAIYLAVKGGTAADPADGRGLSELLSRTLAGGTTRRTARQIAEALQAQGAELTVAAGKEITYLGLQGLAEGSDALLEIVADVVRNPTFPQEEVALAIDNERQAIRANQAEPSYRLDQLFQSRLFGNHPYARVNPDPDAIGRLGRSDLVSAWRRRFRPDQALLVMVGDLPLARMEALAKAHFGPWRVQGAKLPELPPAPTEPRPGLLLVDRPGSVQSTLYVGRPLPPANHPDQFALAVTNTLFGGAFGSRLTQNIREEKGYTYSPSARLSQWAKGGLLRIQASVRNAVTAATLVEIFYELDRLATTLPSDEERLRAQRLLKGRFLLANETAQALATTLTRYWIDGKSPADLARYQPGIDAVTNEQIQRMGRRYFASRQQTVAVSGDAKAIAEQLRLFGDLELLEAEP